MSILHFSDFFETVLNLFGLSDTNQHLNEEEESLFITLLKNI